MSCSTSLRWRQLMMYEGLRAFRSWICILHHVQRVCQCKYCAKANWGINLMFYYVVR
jgi:hypothetical protein